MNRYKPCIRDACLLVLYYQKSIGAKCCPSELKQEIIAHGFLFSMSSNAIFTSVTRMCGDGFLTKEWEDHEDWMRAKRGRRKNVIITQRGIERAELVLNDYSEHYGLDTFELRHPSGHPNLA